MISCFKLVDGELPGNVIMSSRLGLLLHLRQKLQKKAAPCAEAAFLAIKLFTPLRL
jgi:hypothetical protein